MLNERTYGKTLLGQPAVAPERSERAALRAAVEEFVEDAVHELRGLGAAEALC